MFVPTKFLYSPHDPFMDPALRWSRCQYLLEHSQRPSRTLDDAITWDAWRFLRGLGRCRDDAHRQRLIQHHPAIAAAHQFFTNAEPLKRAELEARLLARQTNEIIAAKCNLSPAAVGYYYSLFFNVRSSLQAECYIVNIVIGPKVHYGLTPHDRELILKVVGYSMGGMMVDALLDYFANPPIMPDSLNQLDDAALENLHRKLLLRAMILSLTSPANGVNVARLSDIHNLLGGARVVHQGQASDETGSLSAICAAVDPSEYCSERTIMAPDDSATAAGPSVARAEVGASASGGIHRHLGPVVSHRREWEAVPA